MEPQGKKQINVPKAEPRVFLPCSNDVNRGSALGSTEEEPPVEVLIDRLAQLIVEVYFYDHNNKRR